MNEAELILPPDNSGLGNKDVSGSHSSYSPGDDYGSWITDTVYTAILADATDESPSLSLDKPNPTSRIGHLASADKESTVDTQITDELKKIPEEEEDPKVRDTLVSPDLKTANGKRCGILVTMI